MKDYELADALKSGVLPIPRMRFRVKLMLFQLSLQGNPTACKYFLELTADDDETDDLDSLSDEQLQAIMLREDIPADDPESTGSTEPAHVPDESETRPPGRETERTDLAPAEPAGPADDRRRRGVVSHNRPW